MSNVDSYYKDNYDNILNTGIIGRMSGFVHWLTEFFVPKQDYERVLEVGSGTGQHKYFIKNQFNEYFETDLRNLETEKIQVTINGKKAQVVRSFADAQNLSTFPDQSIDRLVATCVLVHLPDPEKALKEWRRVLAVNGVATVFLPCEPGVALRLFRNFTTIPKSKLMGINHKSIHYREHRNMYIFCDLLIKEVFHGDSIKRIRFPLPFLSWNFRLFDIVIIKKNENGS